MGYKSMRGKEVDIEKLMRQNELMPAIGNMKVNARGDQLGPGGDIVKRREDIVADYYEGHPKPVEPVESIIKPNILTEEMPMSAPLPATTAKSKKNQIEE
jgi:hypothetical protein